MPALAGLFASSLQEAAACFLHGYIPAREPRQALPIAGNSCEPSPLPNPEDDSDDEPCIIPLPVAAPLASSLANEPQPSAADQQARESPATLRQRTQARLAADGRQEKLPVESPAANGTHAANSSSSSSSAAPSPTSKGGMAEAVVPQATSTLLLSFADAELEKRFELWHNRQVYLVSSPAACSGFFFLFAGRREPLALSAGSPDLKPS